MAFPWVPRALSASSSALRSLSYSSRLVQVAPDIHHLLSEPLPRGLVDVVDIELRGGVADKAFQRVVKLVAPAFRGSLSAGDADQGKVLRQHIGAGKVIECRYHQTL